MQVKLDLTGELEEYIKSRAKKEFRSAKQQVLFILNQSYERELELEKNSSLVQSQNGQPVIMYTQSPQNLAQEQINTQYKPQFDNVGTATIELSKNVNNSNNVIVEEPSYDDSYDDSYDEEIEQNSESILY